MLYTLVFFGGPNDGDTTLALRPYEAIKNPDGSVYKSKETSPDHLEWVSDDERRIELYYDPEGNFPTL